MNLPSRRLPNHFLIATICVRPISVPVTPTDRKAKSMSIAPGSAESSSRPLSTAQCSLWLVDQLHPDSSAYNVAVAVRLDGPLDVEALTRRFSRLSRATTCSVRPALPAHRCRAGPSTPDDGPDHAADSGCRKYRPQPCRRVLAGAVQLGGCPLIRARLVKITADRHVLLIVMHHVICDGPSIHLLFDELAAFYAGPPHARAVAATVRRFCRAPERPASRPRRA